MGRFDDFGFLLEQQDDRPPHRDDLQWLVTGIEDEDSVNHIHPLFECSPGTSCARDKGLTLTGARVACCRDASCGAADNLCGMARWRSAAGSRPHAGAAASVPTIRSRRHLPTQDPSPQHTRAATGMSNLNLSARRWAIDWHDAVPRGYAWHRRHPRQRPVHGVVRRCPSSHSTSRSSAARSAALTRSGVASASICRASR